MSGEPGMPGHATIPELKAAAEANLAGSDWAAPNPAMKAIAAADAPLVGIFVDVADGALKFKDAAGDVHVIAFVA